jgi:hypothetical protein
MIRINMAGGAPAGQGQAAPNNSYSFLSTTAPPPVGYNQGAGANFASGDFLLESNVIFWGAAGSSTTISVLGYQDQVNAN